MGFFHYHNAVLFEHVQLILTCQLAIVAQISDVLLLIYFYITANEKTMKSRHALGMNIRDFDDLGVQATTGWRELCGFKTSKIYT